MKSNLLFILFLLGFSGYSQLPEGFIYVQNVIPDLEVELRYNTSNNFVGAPIDGYQANKLILTKEATDALKKVAEELQNKNLCLLVYDGYRPQKAVNYFITWARDLNDTINKNIYYPNVNKEDLFIQEYIARRSGHSRGSTLDLTIFDCNKGKILDMGSPYDFFGVESWVDFEKITDKQKANRQLLQNVMIKYGFRNYPKEWWHFTLNEEPFPRTYFNFAIN